MRYCFVLVFALSSGLITELPMTRFGLETSILPNGATSGVRADDGRLSRLQNCTLIVILNP